MKRLIIILFVLILGAAFKVNIAQDDDGGAVNGYFYSSLSPYGTWIELNDGVTVWRPLHLHRDWSPYRYGHWIWTDDGWYWDSDEPYGNIVYHYGRWYDDDYYGWIWVPDNVWAPAWVEWRYDDNYIGWAPLTPYASFSMGIGISFTENYETPISYWHFVGYHHMCDPYAYNYYVPDRDRHRIFEDTRYRTNYGYSNGRVINRGVDVDYIRQRGGGRIEERQIQRVDDPRNAGGRGNDNVVRAYIPSHEQLTRTDNRNIEIKRGTRPSSLDLTRVNIGRNPAARNENNTPSANREQNRIDNKIPSREAPRDNPGNIRENNTPQIRTDNRQQPRVQSQPQVRTDNRQQQRVQSQPQVRPDYGQQPRVQSRPQVRTDNRQQPRVQSQPQVRTDNRQQPRVQSQPQVRTENRQQPRVQNQPQVKRESSNNNNRQRK